MACRLISGLPTRLHPRCTDIFGMPTAIYKPRGKTPLECVHQYKSTTGTSDVVSYAGRLDPLAEGVLVLLVGDENANRRSLEQVSKVYEVDVVFGIKTDTGDLMGMPTLSDRLPPNISSRVLLQTTASFLGTTVQRYHPYSSTRVDGKPLFYWAREGRLSEITIPTHPISIDSIEIINTRIVSLQSMVDSCNLIVPKVHGEFRQKEIIETWRAVSGDRNFQVFSLRVSCASGGVYMRVLAEDIASMLGTHGFCLRIIRTRVGKWGLDDSLHLWEHDHV